MPHTVQGPMAKILEGMWWFMDHHQPLTDFLNAPGRHGTPHKYRVFDRTIMPAGDVMANECPALTIEPVGGDATPLHDLTFIGNGLDAIIEAQWTLTLWGYINSLDYDEINTFYKHGMDALYSGYMTCWSNGIDLLMGGDQLIQSFTPDWIIPGALWLNPSDVERSGNLPRISFFAHQFTLYLTNVR